MLPPLFADKFKQKSADTFGTQILAMTVRRIKFGTLRTLSHSFGAVAAVMVAVCLGSVAYGQTSGQFVDPEIGASRTLGGQSFGGEGSKQQLESIDGEVIPGSAGLAEPDFGEYGPVSGGAAGRGSTAGQIQRPEQQSGARVLSRSEALPNEYQGETSFPDPEWMGPDTNQGQNSSRRTQFRQPQSRSVVRPQAKSLLKIEELRKAFENNNRDFDSRTHEVVRERYPDGSIKIIRTIAQDAKGNYYNDGKWLMKDRQQRDIAFGIYDRGAMKGNWVRVHEAGTGGLFLQMPFNLFSGPFVSQANFVRNKIDGVWTISDKDGKLIFSITYKNGVRSGPAKWLYPSGNPMREATFKEGVPNGIVLQRDQQGNVQRRDQFVDGRKVIRKNSTYSNQTPASEIVFRDRKLTPQGTDNWWAAKPATFDREGEPVQYGPVAEWYPNRQPKMTGRYIEGQRDGLFTWWHETHNKKAEGNFVKGKRVGLWRYWHESGMKRSEGNFEDDQPVGLWREWDQNGQVVDEKTVDPNAPKAEEVVGEEVESAGSSVLNKADLESSDFKVEIEGENADEPVSNDDPFGEKQPNEKEPGSLGF